MIALIQMDWFAWYRGQSMNRYSTLMSLLFPQTISLKNNTLFHLYSDSVQKQKNYNDYTKIIKSILILIFIQIKKYIRCNIMNLNSTDQKNQWIVLLRSAVVGAVTGMISLPLQHPFDALKTNMQSRQKKIFQTVRLMVQEKGWRAFYNGFSLNLIRIMIKQAYRWPLWISIMAFYKDLLPQTNEILRQSVTGFTVSFAELLIITPLERIKVWLMTTHSQDQTKVLNYYKKSFNFFDLYTGFLSMLIRQGLSWSSFLASSQISKNKMKQFRGTDSLTSVDLFLASIPVSLINTLFIMPIDCIKTFFQQYDGLEKKRPYSKVIRKIYEKHGLRGLYLGWSARLIQYQIQSAFTLVVIQKFHNEYRAGSKKTQS